MKPIKSMLIRHGVFLPAMIVVIASSCAVGGQPVPGEIFKDCPECPEMVAVPAGTFIMGTDGAERSEKPAHRVSIAKPFAIGRYEVTFGQWRACIEEKGCVRIPDDHKWGRGGRPVMNISWPDAAGYLKWLSAKTGHTYRLPTEAEWEYAARAGTSTEYWWGDEVGVEKANCRNCAAEISHETYPVGGFDANPFGLYDVHGNVWEWVQDCWNPNYVEAPGDGSAREKGNCRYRVTRGGSWYYFSKNLRSAYRAKYIAQAFSYGIGLRALRELP